MGHQSGDENSMAMDLNYVSEGETSRRSSLQDSTPIVLEGSASLMKQSSSSEVQVFNIFIEKMLIIE